MDYKDNTKVLKIDLDCSTCNKINNDSKKIPVQRIIQKLDGFFDSNDLSGARDLLEYWQDEARRCSDLSGELSIVNEMLGLYRRTKEPQKAIVAVERSLELLKLTNSEKSISGATILINAATTCNAVGKAQKAVPFYEKAIVIYKNQGLLKNDLRFAALYNNYATTLAEIKEYEKAKELYDKAISITSANAGGILDCAVSYVNLAHLYDNWLGALCPEIENCLNEAQNILESQRVPKNSYYAFVCEKCAPSYEYFGYFIYAQQLKLKAREIYERS